MKNFDVCVLGGGASGSICAIELAKKRLSVCVIDGCDFPAKKIACNWKWKMQFDKQKYVKRILQSKH